MRKALLDVLEGKSSCSSRDDDLAQILRSHNTESLSTIYAKLGMADDWKRVRKKRERSRFNEKGSPFYEIVDFLPSVLCFS